MKFEFEVNFDFWNILSKNHENKYDFFVASSPKIACNMARWKYGDCIDIISVEITE